MVAPRHLVLLVVAAGLALASTAPARASDYQVHVTLEPRTTIPDRLVELRIEVEGGGLGFLRAAAHFELEDLEIFDGPFRSERLRFSFGEAQRTATLRWRLRPVAPGSAAVRNLEVEVRGQRLELPDQTLEVIDAPAEPDPVPRQEETVDPFADLFERWGRQERQPEPRRLTEPQVFLRAELTPSSPYVGQQARYTLYLYTQADVESIHPQELPSFHGFWVAQVEEQGNRETEMVEVEGQRFARAKLFDRVLYPMRPGAFEVEPAQIELVVRRAYVAGSGARFSRPERLRRRSEPLRVEVNPLPPAPEGFTGAVGQFRLEAHLEPPRPRVGEAAMLTLTLTGSGNVDALPQPALPKLPGCTIYPPQEASRHEWKAGRLVGERTWRFVLVPESSGLWSLAPIEVPYFDPRRGTFELASTQPLKLAALPAALAEGQTANGEVADEALRVPAPAATKGHLADFRLWLLTLPLGAAVLFLLARRRRPAAPPALTTFEDDLRIQRPGQSPRRIARHLEAAWRRLLEQAWGIDRHLPARRWPEELAARGAAPEPTAELRELVDELQELRLLPELAAVEGPLRALRARSLALARQLATGPRAGRTR